MRGAAAQATSSISGQAYPAKPVRFVVGSTPQEFAAHIKDELARIGKVTQVAGITMK